jgi:hypothetical protein
MLVEAIPEEEWTPWQREQVRHWKRLWIRDDQWRRIEEWKIRQQHTRDWVCLADIADWCARRPSDVERDPPRGMQAYSDLQQSIGLGEFSEADRLKVIYLGPQPPSLRDRVRLRLDVGYLLAQNGRVLDHVLHLCWAPRELCVRWLVARQIVPPPSLTEKPMRAELPHDAKASKPGVTSSTLSPSRAPEDRIHTAIDVVYAASRGKPPNLKQVVPLAIVELRTTNQFATRKEIEHCAKDPRHAGKRRPRGRTLKSEQIRRSDS